MITALPKKRPLSRTLRSVVETVEERHQPQWGVWRKQNTESP